MKSEKLLRVEEVGAMLGLRPSCIRKWVFSGRIACVKLGRRAIRIPIEEVQRLIAVGYRPPVQDRPKAQAVSR